MENSSYYHDLAERIYFLGLEIGDLNGVATFKDSKSNEDLRQAIREPGGLDGFGKFPSMARRIGEIIEINPSAYDERFGRPDTC